MYFLSGQCKNDEYLNNGTISNYNSHTFLADAEDCVNGTSTDRCDQICTNTDGSFVCECNTGYQLDDDMITCSGM